MVFYLLLVVFPNYAQTVSLPFLQGEEFHYDIYYKYGLVMLKAGRSRYHIDITTYNNQSAYKSSLDFKTVSFFDKVFKIRDTLNSYISIPDLVPLFHNRNVNEGNYHYTEQIFVHQQSPIYSEVRVIQEKNNQVRFDTILNANDLGYDILNVFMFVRTLDYSEMKQGDSFRFTVFMGKDIINIIAHYAGPMVIEKSKWLKYKAIKLNVDITDAAFKEPDNSMEIWISDDENKIPLKLKAKLKIGAAEAILSSYKNLKHPFSAKIIIPHRK